MPTLDEKPATAKSAKNRKSLAPRLPATAAGKLATATGKQAAATGKQAAAAGKQAGNSQMGIEAQSFYKSPVKKSTKSEKVGGIFLYIFLLYFNRLIRFPLVLSLCQMSAIGTIPLFLEF
jgi:hypothetical protein